MVSVSSALVSEPSVPAQVGKTYFVREFSRTREVNGVNTGMPNFRREGEMGNPGIFGVEFIPELMELQGDRGGKRILCAHRDEVFIFSDTKPEELEDIDFKC